MANDAYKADGNALHSRLGRVLSIRPGEGRLVAWSALYIFCVLCAYYVIRPIRDTMGIGGGVHNLQWLFTGTLVCMVLANLPFSALSRTLPRARFITITYRFFTAQLLLFAIVMTVSDPSQIVWVGRVFFVWVSVFNLFVVSVFWALVVDVFNTHQGKRLFALLAAGATCGAIVGSATTAELAKHVSPAGLLLIAAALLEIAVLCVARLSKHSQQALPSVECTNEASATIENAKPHRPRARPPTSAATDATAPLGGSVLAGITRTIRSPYLANICLYMLLFSIASTILYFEQATLIHRAIPSSAARLKLFATLDLVGNSLTLVLQLTMTSRIVRLFGVALTIAIIPALSALGFGILALWPTMTALIGFAVLRRAGNFAIARPTREMLFTVIGREDKYKAKTFIDTVLYRLGDQVGAWTYAGFSSAGLSAAMMALVAALVSLAWLVNSYWLGQRQQKMSAHSAV
jgi:AAA family ATP:ADP antiporter